MTNRLLLAALAAVLPTPALAQTAAGAADRATFLVLQGVTADQAPELAAAFREAGNRDVTVRVFPNTNHLFLHDPSGVYSGYATLPSKSVGPEVLGVLADWVVARLGPTTR